MRDIGVPSGRGILAGTAPSIYHIPNFSPRLPHPSDVLRVERLSKEREADEEAVKAELEPSFGNPHRKAGRVHFDSLGLDDHRLLLSMTAYVSNATAPVAHSGTSSPGVRAVKLLAVRPTTRSPRAKSSPLVAFSFLRTTLRVSSTLGLAPSRERLPELDPDLRPRLRNQSVVGVPGEGILFRHFP